MVFLGDKIDFQMFFSNEMNEMYKKNLIDNGFFDTFFLVIRK